MTARLESPAARMALVRHKARARRVDALLAQSAADRAVLAARIARLDAVHARIVATLGAVRASESAWEATR